jgi:hypothetical protein
MNNIEHILPEIMILLNVPLESTFRILIKDETLKITNIANVVHVLIILGLLISQCSKRVNNNTENDIETDDIDNNLE